MLQTTWCKVEYCFYVNKYEAHIENYHGKKHLVYISLISHFNIHVQQFSSGICLKILALIWNTLCKRSKQDDHLIVLMFFTLLQMVLKTSKNVEFIVFYVNAVLLDINKKLMKTIFTLQKKSDFKILKILTFSGYIFQCILILYLLNTLKKKILTNKPIQLITTIKNKFKNELLTIRSTEVFILLKI